MRGLVGDEWNLSTLYLQVATERIYREGRKCR
jgi:hypothetical protein